MAVRFVIIGGGPAGTTAATHAARLGADVTIIERDVVGGSANLWDCIPSKAMIATGGMMSATGRAPRMGLAPMKPELDLEALRGRIASISGHLEHSTHDLLDSQGVRLLVGTGRLAGPHSVVADTDEGPVDAARIDWLGESERDVRDALEAVSQGETRSKVEEATEWLGEFMESRGGFELSDTVKSAGKRDGHSLSTLHRARHRLKISVESAGFPRRTYWVTPGVEVPDQIEDA